MEFSIKQGCGYRERYDDTFGFRQRPQHSKAKSTTTVKAVEVSSSKSKGDGGGRESFFHPQAQKSSLEGIQRENCWHQLWSSRVRVKV